MTSINERLRAERTRIGLSLNALAARAAVSKGTQIKYESGETAPNAVYLAVMHELGADVQYLVTGERSQGVYSLAASESLLLDAVAVMSEQSQAALLLIAGALAEKDRVRVAYPSDTVATVLRTGEAGQQSQAQGQSQSQTQYQGHGGGLSDAELWRAVARSLPTTPGVDPAARLSLTDFLAIVDARFADELQQRQQQAAVDAMKQGRATQ